ncbi:DUF4118 domain-containing protein [Gemmatimonas sp.]|jgi:two-component system sensor histidine kinase KdpD|uniref:sensor histidine kinase n=1 Tax=Gemmatimonas sp. TaxID=1962908 RepID=UPI00391F8C79
MRDQNDRGVRTGRGIVLGAALLAAVTTGLVRYQTLLGAVHVALLYLLIVLLVSARYGRVAGMVMSGLAFLAFNFFFIPPYHTLAIGNPLDWLVLAVFLATALTAAQLLHRARRESALREAARVKDALLAGVSHDIRTPLTSIRAIAHEVAQDGDERGLVIEEESIRLTQFVEDMLDLSRLRVGGLVVASAINAADDVVGAALQRVAGIAGDREIVARVEGEPLLAGRFDFTHTLRVVANLLENAIKYSPRDAAVELAVRREGDRLLFVVADRGPGLPPGEEEAVFSAFYRPRHAVPDARSAGLGLALARGLAEVQQGALSYAPRPGGGSVFTLSLPAVDLHDSLSVL